MTKDDKCVFHSPDHANLQEIGLPQTKFCHKTYAKQRSSSMEEFESHSETTNILKGLIRSLNVSEFIIKNIFKGENGLLLAAKI